MSDLFVLGFDPVFLDVIVIPMNPDQSKLTEFPEIGEHVSTTKVTMLPGGNALNVARILSKLSSKVAFFGNFNNFFAELIQTDIPSLECHATSFEEPNVTVALQFARGEVQMNAVTSAYGPEHLSLESLYYLLFSTNVPFSNMGLNPRAPDLFDVLTAFFHDFVRLTSSKGPFTKLESLVTFLIDFGTAHNLSQFTTSTIESSTLPFDLSTIPDLNKKIFYFDSSTLQSFSQWPWLNTFFSTKYNALPGYKLISINEHEFNAMIKNNINLDSFLNSENTFLVVHEASKVSFYSQSLSHVTSFPVPPLSPDQIVSSVGPGDAFTAGLVLEFSKSFDILKACQHAVTIAQRFLTGTLEKKSV